jgi:hypothetical protein
LFILTTPFEKMFFLLKTEMKNGAGSKLKQGRLEHTSYLCTLGLKPQKQT